MFKQGGSIWLYLIGIVLMFAILVIVGKNYVIPLLFERKPVDLSQSFDVRPAFTIDTKKDYLAKVNTNFGSFTIDLYEKNAPQNVNNVIYLANKGYYTRTKFHRLIPGLLIQGGDRNTLDDDPSN